MDLVAEKGREPARPVGFGRKLLNLSPVGLYGVKPPHELSVLAAGNLAHVGPLTLGRESEEVEVTLSDIECAFKRSFNLADGIMIVKVAPVEVLLLCRAFVLNWPRRRSRGAAG